MRVAKKGGFPSMDIDFILTEQYKKEDVRLAMEAAQFVVEITKKSQKISSEGAN